ncbi:MAG: hypothetical protein PHP80_09855 [Synergistaceae bacterium]|nr:hypothetical protein [Synergistaceae bacterium]
MKRTRIMRVLLFFLFSALFLCAAAVPPSSADYSTSGAVGGPYPYTYTVKCNPGDSFTVSVGSNYPTSVDILFMTPAGNEWAFNSVAGSDKRTSHELSHTAPSSPPKNNAAYHHYKVSILASTNKQTRFSLKITQRGNNKNLDREYVERAIKQLDALAKAMSNERQRLSGEIKQRVDRIKGIDEQQKRRKTQIDAERAELARMADAIRSEQNKAVRSSMLQTYKFRQADFNADVENFNQVNASRRALYNDYKGIREQREALDSFAKSIKDAWQQNDVDRCVLIANGSKLAQSLGWRTMKR